jgi:hypothetical protein
MDMRQESRKTRQERIQMLDVKTSSALIAAIVCSIVLTAIQTRDRKPWISFCFGTAGLTLSVVAVAYDSVGYFFLAQSLYLCPFLLDRVFFADILVIVLKRVFPTMPLPDYRELWGLFTQKCVLFIYLLVKLHSLAAIIFLFWLFTWTLH